MENKIVYFDRAEMTPEVDMRDVEPRSIHNSIGLLYHILPSTPLTTTRGHITVHKNARMW